MILLYVYCLLWVINIIFALANKRSKAVVFITWCLLFAVFAGSDGLTGDAFKYKADYELGVFGVNWSEIGYSIFMNLCKSIGLTQYNEFLVVLFLSGSILAYVGLKKMHANFHALFAITMGFIFPSLSTAIRYYIAVAVFLFALPYMIDRTVVCLVVCLIAVSFHKSALFLLIFPLGTMLLWSKQKLEFRKNLLFVFVSFTTFVTIYVYFFREFPLQNLLYYALDNLHIPTSKIDSYLRTVTRYGWMLLALIYILNLVFFVILQRSCKKILNIDLRKISIAAFIINVTSLALLPFARFNLVFFRLLIYQTITNAILYGAVLSIKPIEPESNFRFTNNISMKLSFLAIIFAWFLLSLYAVNSISIFNTIINTIWVK